jgi:hypothetical protein
MERWDPRPAASPRRSPAPIAPAMEGVEGRKVEGKISHHLFPAPVK